MIALHHRCSSSVYARSQTHSGRCNSLKFMGCLKAVIQPACSVSLSCGQLRGSSVWRKNRIAPDEERRAKSLAAFVLWAHLSAPDEERIAIPCFAGTKCHQHPIRRSLARFLQDDRRCEEENFLRSSWNPAGVCSTWIAEHVHWDSPPANSDPYLLQ